MYGYLNTISRATRRLFSYSAYHNKNFYILLISYLIYIEDIRNIALIKADA